MNTKQLEAIKRELSFISREVQRINGNDSETFDSVDAIAHAARIALDFIFEIELETQPEVLDDEHLIAA